MASCIDMELNEVEPDGLSAAEDLRVSGAPCTEKPSKGLIQMDADEPLDKASPSPWGEFLKELALTMSSSMHMGETAPSLLERRSYCLDKKNKDCDIPVAKRTEYRRAEAFGEVPKFKSKGKTNEEVPNEKMHHYLQMCKKQHTPQTIEAVHALVDVNPLDHFCCEGARRCAASGESLCVVCLCWIQGVASILLRFRGSCI
jgi:hypothetical protein